MLSGICCFTQVSAELLLSKIRGNALLLVCEHYVSVRLRQGVMSVFVSRGS